MGLALFLALLTGVVAGYVPLAQPHSKRCLSPRLALDGGGAAIAIRDFDVWAGSSPLIEDVSWNVMPKERWSLLGPNGCGKSTLLRAIAEIAQSGSDGSELANSVYVDGKLQFGMLEQTAVSGAETSVRDEVMSRMTAYQSAKTELQAAEVACTSGDAAEVERLERATAAFEAAGGYTVDSRVSRVLKGLGFEDSEFERPCSSFSGGWQMRIGLARLLLSEPELLVMDEPTNHLDAAARRWLATYVADYSGTVLVVSHDEAFVSVACDSIAEVSGGRLELYKSVPFAKYTEEREERQRRAVATVEAQEREAARLQGFIDRMGAKASKAKQAKDRQGKLDRLAAEMSQSQALVVGARRQPKLVLADPPACGGRPLALRGAALAHAEGAKTIIKACDLDVTRGRRLILRGPNGAGKSTILKALSGSLELVAGTREVDDKLRLGLFAQDLAQELPQSERALDYVMATVREHDPSLEDERCRTVMGSLGLVGEKALRQIGSLSGGEKARVALATFCLTPCNVLLLDEPTNHLDVDAIAALLEALEAYTGAIVVVSHDRPFCEALRCSHVGYVADGRCTVEERELRNADFSTAARGVRNTEEDGVVEDATTVAESAEQAKAAREMDRQLQKMRKSARPKVAKLEASIADAEEQIERLDGEMVQAGADLGKLAELGTQRDTLQAKIDAWYEEWEGLEELLAEIA